MAKLVFLPLLLCLLAVLTACNQQGSTNTDPPVIDGYIIEAEENEILVVSNITREQAETITRESIFQMEGINAIVFDLSNTSVGYEKGQRVQVWAKGGIRESFPSQAEAETIKIIEE